MKQRPADKIIEGLRDAVAHARGELPLRYDCGHLHETFKDALECRMKSIADQPKAVRGRR